MLSARRPTSAGVRTVLLRNPVRRSRRSTRSCCCRASRPCRCGWSATRATRWRSPSTSRATTGRVGLLPGPRVTPSTSATADKYPAGAATAALVAFGIKGGMRGRQEVHRVARAVQPPREHRRRQVAGDPPRLDDPLPAQRGGAGRRRRHAGHRPALGRASSTSTTSSPTSTRRSPRRAPEPVGWKLAGGALGPVETKRVVLFSESDPLGLASGRALAPVEVAYETYGSSRRSATTRCSSAMR